MTPTPVKPAVPSAALEAIDIRVGTIERVEGIPKSDTLVRLIVNFGDHRTKRSRPARTAAIPGTMSGRALGIVAVGLLVILTGCRRNEYRYLARSVARAELVGGWAATPFGMESLKSAGYKAHLDPGRHRLALRADGSCRADSVLDPASPGLDGTGIWVAGDVPCTWDLALEDGHQVLEMWVQMIPGKPEPMRFNFDEEDGRLVLWRHAGDPGARTYMEFRKSPPAG